ncbi:hypothetical protein RHSIM_Rhsim05G0020600 [Rhododendron simsii]|uniref:Histone-binding protein RBBP4-like N-terminal domain-containing protein n=1 Tax=Rhododendron simsii TaxID=118357 RepID=A0A834LMA9_RHOSS|nr:hypothetical protein RHSIM_Rhsim05G0020600 [Rhododendron simsii]
MPPMEEEEEAATPTPLPKKRGRPRKDKPKEEREREETPAEKMREKKQPHHASTVDEKYMQWKSLVPVLYDWLANHNLLWPSLSCRSLVDLEAVKSYISFQLVNSEGRLCEGAAQSGLLNLLVRLKCSLVGSVFKLVISRIYSLWGPQLEQGKFKNRQRLYLSEQTDGSVPNTLVIANCEVVKSRVAAAEHVAEFNEEARSPFVKKYKTIIHPGEVNRIRELPQNNSIVATHTDCPEVFIWDVEAQPNRHAVLGAADSRPDLVLTGHQENAEFALAMCPTEPLVLSGGRDKSVVLWSIQDHVSTLTTDAATKPAGSVIKSTDNSSIGPRGVFQGHEDTVEDVQFCPSSAQEFCSVGDDSCLILWDARVGLNPTVKVEKAHNADLHCVDWNPHDSNLILTGYSLHPLIFLLLTELWDMKYLVCGILLNVDQNGLCFPLNLAELELSYVRSRSADQSVRMFDRRNLISNGVGSPIHKFEGHKAAVLCVQWSPDRPSVFGSSAEDGLLNIWDYEKVGETREHGGRTPHSPPGLFFQHAGHRDKVVDFHWNAADPWTIVSVSDDCDTSGGGGTLQIWRMSDLIYRPEEEVVAELEKFKSHVIECTSKS